MLLSGLFIHPRKPPPPPCPQLITAATTQVNAQDDDGQTPLHYAALCGHEHIAHLLIEAGAESGITDASGQTARETGPAGWSWPH